MGLIINVRERKFHANFDVENKSSKDLLNFRSQARKFLGTEFGLKWVLNFCQQIAMTYLPHARSVCGQKVLLSMRRSHTRTNDV